MQDIARGAEPVRIPVLGITPAQTDRLLDSFHTYSADSVLPDGSSLADSYVTAAASNHYETVLSGSDSDSSASDGDRHACLCIQSSGSSLIPLCTVGDGASCDCVGSFGNFYTRPPGPGRAFTHEQVLNLDALPERLPLVECSSSCPCGVACANRVTQRGVRAALAIQPASSGIGLGLFYTPSNGKVLDRGTFISLYAGEYLSDAEARIRWHHQQVAKEIQEGQGNYILSLRLPGQTIHIDPRHTGNVGRFLNHSCQANCVIHPVRWGAAPDTWYRAAIFTNRDLAPGEELTFDYANASGAKRERFGTGDISRTDADPCAACPLGRTRCLCGADACRGWMPFDETL